MLTDSFADLRTGFPITILCLAIVFELVAATFLIFGRDATIKWLVLAGVFSLFLCVSLIRYSMGITGCGCFGAIELPRWVLPLNSVAVLAGLFVFARHPRSRGFFQFRTTIRCLHNRLKSPAVGGGLVCLLLVVSGLVGFPWVQDYPIVTSFLGESPMPVVKYSAGDLAVDQPIDLVIPWRNGTSAKVVFLGSQTSCTCVGLTNPNLSADPQEQVELKVNVRPRKPGLFHQRIVCFVDHPHQDRLTLDVIANAVMPHREN